MSDIKKNTEQRMLKSLESLKIDLGKIRTGRAHTGILDHVMVEYYGSMVSVNQVANINLIDSRTLGVQPFEKQMAGKIGDPTVPNGIKKAAIKTIRELHKRYAATGAAASPPPAADGWSVQEIK